MEHLRNVCIFLFLLLRVLRIFAPYAFVVSCRSFILSIFLSASLSRYSHRELEQKKKQKQTHQHIQ